MRLSDTDLATLQGKASNLAERIAGEFVPAAADDALAARRLARWRHVTGNDPAQFAGILGAIGIEDSAEGNLLSLLGPVRRRPGAALTAWAAMLEQIVEFTSEAGGRQLPRKSRGHRVPYADLYQPTVVLARATIEEDNAGAGERLGDQAWRGLEEELGRRISGVTSVALHSRFLANKAIRESGMMQQLFGGDQAAGGETGPNPLYRGFVAEERADGLRSFFMQNPVAGRLVAEITLNWIASMREFLQRLESDRNELAIHFNGGQPMGELLAVKGGISDPHRGGRSVLIVTFAGRTQLVYKPRSMEIDKLFFEFVGELNPRSSAPQLRPLKVLDRGDHGWMEFARHSACSSPRGADNFYQRAGALVSVVHWLNGIDCHHENLVAAGDDPVLVDLESLAHPSWPGEELPEAAEIACSVLRTGLLPVRQASPSGSATYDHSAFGAPARQRSMFRVARWQQVNTDQMQLSFEKPDYYHAEHRPRLGHRGLAMWRFEQQVLSGYRQMCAVLERDQGRSFAHWQELFYRTLRRRITKPTALYGVVQRRSLRPENLANGVDRSIELHALPYQGVDETWPQEISSLERLDVPYFQIAAFPVMPPAKIDGQEETIRLSIRANRRRGGPSANRVRKERL